MYRVFDYSAEMVKPGRRHYNLTKLHSSSFFQLHFLSGMRVCGFFAGCIPVKRIGRILKLVGTRRSGLANFVPRGVRLSKKNQSRSHPATVYFSPNSICIPPANSGIPSPSFMPSKTPPKSRQGLICVSNNQNKVTKSCCTMP